MAHIRSTRHPVFYMDDGSVIFEVRISLYFVSQKIKDSLHVKIPGKPTGTLYCLPRTALAMRSGFFKTLFSIPRDFKNLTDEGSHDDHPIILSGLSVIDFDRTLRYLLCG